MSVHYLSYNIYNIIFIVLVVLPLAISAQFTNVDSCINITSGSYILVSNFIASRSPCIIIQGSGVELHGNSFTITDNTGSLVGVHVEGSGHYIHDLNVENFAIGLDLYTSNTTIHNVGIDAYTSGNTIGIRASTCTNLEILGSSDPFNLTSTSGSVVGLQINDCVGVHVTNLGLNAQGGVSTTGIQIINSANGFFDSYSLEQHCNPTGVQVTSSRNIRLYAGTTRIYGCATDTTDVVGILVDGSSDILVSKANSLAFSGPNKNFAIWGKSSKYIGLYQSNLEVRLSTVPVEVKVILLQNTIGFSVEHSSLIGFASVNESVGIYLMSNSQLGLHLSQVQTVVTGVFVDTTSTFYANSLESTATTVYNFENDAGLCTNQALNEDPQNSCYPPSNDSCCDSFCHRDGASCLQPTISTVLGVPFSSSGAFITILGSDFGDNYYDTVVAFNDSLCLIHDRSDSFIVCWITGDSFSTSSTTEMSLTNGWNTYTSPSLATVICEANSDCPSNVCYNGECVAETNNTIIAGEALVLVITLGKNNTLVITIPANTFPAGYNVLSLSKAISPISLASGYSKIADFEFRVLDLNRQIVNAFASGVSFSFTGSDIRSSLNLFASVPQLLEANSWSSGSLSFVVTQASSTGVYALVTPSPSILNITRAPTSGGRVIISGANFGTSKNNLVAIVSGSTQSMYCPLHVSSALVSESSLECDLPAGVGQQLQFSVQFNYPSGIISALYSYAYLAPSISAVRPDRRISSSELPGLVITVVGTNFGASNAQQHSTAPVFRVSLAGQDCSNITFVESQTTFTCQLGSRSSTREIENLQVAVGDVSDLTWQMANYNMTFEPCNTTACIIGCDGVVGSGLVNDTCGVCGGDNSTCLIGCDGVVGSRLVNDSCGVCGGNNTCLITPVPVTTSGNNGKGGDDDDHHGAIIGGVIGGFVGLVLIALLVAFLVRRHRQNNRPQPPPEFTVTDVHAGKRFGIEELGTGYAQRGLQTPPIPARPPSGGPANL